MSNYPDTEQTKTLTNAAHVALDLTFTFADEQVVLVPRGDHTEDIELAQATGGTAVEVCAAGSTEPIGPYDARRFPRWLLAAGNTDFTCHFIHIERPNGG